ncbi:MAG TPA: aminoacyl-tRNA hydrolase, partial [Actinomycetes bacterium]|nr:aminoacyl-tRNA hydrolase [Actinomycetes bacterium]
MDKADGGPWIVLGLGNPDDEYGNTRHNAGAMVVTRLAERAGTR